jgi:putative mRNA 3-end processing factor
MLGCQLMEFQFLGGASEVGRLGMVLKSGPTSTLFDYGLLPKDPPQYPIPAPPVDGMFVSHAHLDHTGMIPWITRRQDVDVVLTPPTADVADLLLQDSLKIADAEGFDAPFDDQDLRTARRRFRTIDFGDNVDMGELEVTAHPAGHIPGATMYEVNGNQTMLFTGDLHTLTTDLVWGAKPVKCDTLFVESTYAGRQHPERLKSEYAFLKKIEQVVNRGGIALVPSFAVGRTQDIILTLAKARHEVWLDGMGKKVNSIYIEHPEYIRSAKKLRQAMHHVNVVDGPRTRQLAVKGEVIVCTSGMLDGGPVLHYLDAIREDPKSAILLTGYQVEGTNGRQLVDTGSVELYGVNVDIKIEWQKFDFSAHAGHDELVRFIESCDPQRVVLMHGDQRELLAEALEGREVLLPMEGNWYSL